MLLEFTSIMSDAPIGFLPLEAAQQMKHINFNGLK